MGAYLSQPVTRKDSSDGSDASYAYGTSSMQGWRTNMEDAHATILDLDASTAFFAVFDGHGGKEVALYAAKHLHEALRETASFARGDLARGLEESFLELDRKMLAKEAASELRALRSGSGSDDDGGFGGLLGEGTSAEEKKKQRAEINAKLRAALIEQMKETNPDIDERDIKFDFELDDSDFEELTPSSSGNAGGDLLEHWAGPQAGATSVVVCIRGNKAYCANAGDSRAVFCRKGGVAVDMSADHKPMNEEERRRITNAGGFVSEGRVNGSLALSRALGDFEYKRNKELSEKEQAVTAFPEVREFELQEDDEFMVLACDGIWDVMSSQECVSFVRERLVAELKSGGSAALKVSRICEELCDRCLAPDTRGSGLGCDNMSVVVVVMRKFLSANSS